MSRDRSKDLPKSAAELVAELQCNPTYVERTRDREKEQQRNAANYAAAAEPVLRDLVASGLRVTAIGQIRKHRSNYQTATPILLRWLSKIEDIQVKEDIVRTLSVPWAKPDAAKPLLREFEGADDASGTGIRWTIANALEVVADDSVFDEVLCLAQNRSYGKAREMLVTALGNMQPDRAVPALTEFLQDGDLVGHAVIGLGKLKTFRARPYLEAQLNHPKQWVREEAKKALARIEVNK